MMTLVNTLVYRNFRHTQTTGNHHIKNPFIVLVRQDIQPLIGTNVWKPIKAQRWTMMTLTIAEWAVSILSNSTRSLTLSL